jgi:hypothetical protein
MWVFAQNGFYSIVKFEPKKDPARKVSSKRNGKQQKVRDDVQYVLVRGRVKEDLEYFARWMNDREQLSNVIWFVEEDDKADYLFRMVVPRGAWSEFLHDQAENIDYTNFKSNIADHSRSGVYMRVWSTVMALQPRRWTRSTFGFGFGRKDREPSIFDSIDYYTEHDDAADGDTCDICGDPILECLCDDDGLDMEEDEIRRVLSTPLAAMTQAAYDIYCKIEDGKVKVRKPDVPVNP